MPPRMCKGCGGPVKGHQGPVGAGKCQNEPVGNNTSDAGNDSKIDESKSVANETETLDETSATPSKGRSTARGGGRGKKKVVEEEEITEEDKQEEDKVEETTENKKTTAKAKGRATKGRQKKAATTPDNNDDDDQENKEQENEDGEQSVDAPSKDNSLDETGKSKAKSKKGKHKKDKSPEKEENEVEEEKDSSITANDDEKSKSENAKAKPKRGRQNKDKSPEKEENEEKDSSITSNDDNKSESENAKAKPKRGRQKKIPSPEKDQVEENNDNDTVNATNNDTSVEETAAKAKLKRGGRQKKVKSPGKEDNEDNDEKQSYTVDSKGDNIDDADKMKGKTGKGKPKKTPTNKSDSEKEDNIKEITEEEDVENDESAVENNENHNEESKDSENIETSEEASVENTVEEAEIDSKDNDKDNSKKRVLGDITNTVQDDSSKPNELEGTFVVGAENNNDAKTPDAERKKKQTKEKQTRRRTFVIEESPTNATGAIDSIQEGDETSEGQDGQIIPNPQDLDWTLDLSIDKVTEWKRERLYSKSDYTFDVRSFVADKTFQLCGCSYIDEPPFVCECDATIIINKDMSGTVLDMFYNPLNEDEDMKPEFKITSESWNPEKPNVLKVMFTKVKKREITSISGEITITGERCLELEKGRKIRCMFFLAELDLTINCSKPFLAKLNKTRFNEIGNPIKFKTLKCDMIAMEHAETEHADGTKGSNFTADESIISKSADMTQSGNVEEREDSSTHHQQD